MMGYLYYSGRQMTPVMAKHSLFRLRFNIPRKQRTLLTIVDFYHTGAIVPPFGIALRWPVDGEG